MVSVIKKICLLSHGQPSRNPRLVRYATVLANAGYEVVVITPQLVERCVIYDDELIKNVEWEYIPIDFSQTYLKRTYWHYVRLRHRIAKLLSRWFLTETIVGYASDYLNIELYKLAVNSQADLYIAHQQQSLPAAAWAAKYTDKKFAVDIHDLLADSPSEPRHLIENIEKNYLSKCSCISTMSSTAAQRIQQVNNLLEQPIVLHNTPELCEREGILPPEQRSIQKQITIYWFGQTIGSHSRADQVIRAMPLLEQPVKLVLRGHPNEEFINQIETLAQELGVEHCLEILPVASPTEMVKLAAEYDILLGTQPGDDLFHQMAIGNKVFTGMMAGLALALTDTIAYRQLLSKSPDCGFLFSDVNETALANQLNILIRYPEKLQDMKDNSWCLAEKYYNWEEESKVLLNQLSRITI